MSIFIESMLRTAVIGIGATAIMDVWLIALNRMGVATLNFALLGRWVGHLFGGKWFHDGMAKAAPIKNELRIGWLAHYTIGIAFAGLLLSLFGLAWAQTPTLAPAVGTGLATLIAPLCILQPAMGSGIAFSKTATPLRNCLRSLANHAVFGTGLYLTTFVLARWI